MYSAHIMNHKTAILLLQQYRITLNTIDKQ